MYLIVAFFNEKILTSKQCYYSDQYYEHIKTVFPNYGELNDAAIEGCIGFFKGKAHRDKRCFLLDIENVSAKEDCSTFDFETGRELEITNGAIEKSLYRFACKQGWVNKENKYYPSLCIVEKAEFEKVLNGAQYDSTSGRSERLKALMAKCSWSDICGMYEPLEKLYENNEIWSNPADLYNLAFACSKLGEPQNGLERDRAHLEKIKRYRELSIALFKRCSELEPAKNAYASAVAYRPYQNINELTKPKGRRDGKLEDEMREAIKWLDKALEINPASIKDNYRKGKLLLEKAVDCLFRNSEKHDREFYAKAEKIEKDGIECLENVIRVYEAADSESLKRRYRNEYVKALYTLGCHYIEKPKNRWYSFACCKMLGLRPDNYVAREEYEHISKARHYFEQCFNA